MKCRRFAGKTAAVIGSGPNGLSAAIVLAQAGLHVDVYEAEAIPGGACRTLELTLPGFLHDFGSAVHPMGKGSPFFESLPLEQYGLEWVDSPVPLAHPFADGTAVTLEKDLGEQARVLGRDGAAWAKLFGPLVAHWREIREAILRPFTPLSGPIWRHPLLMTRFGVPALLPATVLARALFREERTRGLFAGLAAHSFLSLDAPLSSSFGMVLALVGHAVGWPVPRGGSQAITRALLRHLEALGGVVHTGRRVERLADLPPVDVTICDVTPRQLLFMAGERLSPAYQRRMRAFRYGPAAFKVDYALKGPIPWRAPECLRAATVHVGGSMEEVAASERAMARGREAERPFLLVAQPSLFDRSRVPEGSAETAWVYCHVPNGSAVEMLPVVEAQIERFAPGFGEVVLARSVLTPARLESMDANLVGGDINGGAMGGGALGASQFVLRPTARFYGTSARDLFLCSSSTPPGGGVHGMCGHNAARDALRFLGAK